MRTLFIAENLIYFVNLSAIITNIFYCNTKKSKYIFSLCCNIIILMLSLCLSNDVFFYIHLLFPLFQILALCFSFEGLKLSSLIYTYIFIYTINSILVAFISLITNIKYSDTLWVDFIVNTALSQ